MTVSETKLLPCPFCGGQPHVSTRQDEDLATHNIVEWTRVYCIECSIGFEMPPGYDSEPVTQWNTRALTAALSDQAGGWQDISTAPKDGTVFDVWLGGPDIDEDDIEFYCGVGTRRSASWHYLNGKFRPCAGLSSIPTFVHPTHWQPLPAPPPSSSAGEGK